MPCAVHEDALLKKNVHDVFIAIGSNLGDRETNLCIALEQMAAGIEITVTSSVYETQPWGLVEQPEFLNQVVRGITSLTPFRLLAFLKKIELRMGRVKTFRYGPRLIDLDVLLYDDRQVCNPRLTIPHPRMCQRAFVLVPLAEIIPDTIIPGTGLTVQQHLAKLEVTGIAIVDTARLEVGE
jgi:2-amino-4-hydroxy-6-hydroxymethyldihydropteridine diphosphokinase